MKLVTEHPTFKRLFAHVEKLIAAADLQSVFIIQNPHLLLAPDTLQNHVAKAEAVMRKRLYREYGLNGKYVAH